MNYEALLSKIGTLEARYTDYPTYLALQAVVELHQPTSDGMCGKCSGLAADWVTYPCATIKVIEKKLNHGV